MVLSNKSVTAVAELCDVYGAKWCDNDGISNVLG